MTGEERTCPYCCEVIHAQAIKCKHCSSNLSAESAEDLPLKDTEEPISPPSAEIQAPASQVSGEEAGRPNPVRTVKPEPRISNGIPQGDDMMAHGVGGIIMSMISLFLFFTAYGSVVVDYDVAFMVTILSAVGITPWMTYVITRPGSSKWLPGASLMIIAIMMAAITGDPSSPYFVDLG